MCYVDDGDLCTVWKEVKQKARKEHECGCCGATISVGQLYMRTGALFDGHWSTYIDCGRCIRAGDEFSKLHGITYRGVPLADNIKSCLGDEPESLAWIGKFFQIDRSEDNDLKIRWDLPEPIGTQQ